MVSYVVVGGVELRLGEGWRGRLNPVVVACPECGARPLDQCRKSATGGMRAPHLARRVAVEDEVIERLRRR